ncbi:MAG: hypothetical protein ABI831_06875, partial [Betaproteobacteria bacterium]
GCMHPLVGIPEPPAKMALVKGKGKAGGNGSVAGGTGMARAGGTGMTGAKGAGSTDPTAKGAKAATTPPKAGAAAENMAPVKPKPPAS